MPRLSNVFSNDFFLLIFATMNPEIWEIIGGGIGGPGGPGKVRVSRAGANVYAGMMIKSVFIFMS